MTYSTNKYDLIIFDMDGTLADRDTGELLEGVEEWFESYRHNTGGKKLAIATNQGGVGLRYWMETEGFGNNPGDYPTEDDFWGSANSLIKRLGISEIQLPVFVCYRYQSKKSGKWSPVPTGKELEKSWQRGSRKPYNGLLHDAMLHWRTTPEYTLMVGDRDEDKGAAESTGCDFVWAHEFFGRSE